MNTYVGIDVAKQFFDRYDLATEKHQRFDHTAEGIAACITSLTACTPALIVMESTGGYETNLAVAPDSDPGPGCPWPSSIPNAFGILPGPWDGWPRRTKSMRG